MKKNDRKLNNISVFLYSFGLVFTEILILDLFLSSKNITEYKMNFSIGLILTFIIIGLITTVYMSDSILAEYKEAIMKSKINKIFTIIGILSTIFLANYFLRQNIFSLGIIPILIIIVLSFVIGRYVEKRDKNK